MVAGMRSLLLTMTLSLSAAGCANDTLTVGRDGASPLCVWHFLAPGMTSDSDETPGATCAYSNGINGYVTFQAHVPNRFDINYTMQVGTWMNVRTAQMQGLGNLSVVGGCPEWDWNSTAKMTGDPTSRPMPGDLFMMDISAQCAGYSFAGFIGRRM